MTFADSPTDFDTADRSAVAMPVMCSSADTFVVEVDPDWRAASGDHLRGESICLRTVGKADGPAVLVLGGLSADGSVTSIDQGWWQDVAGPGRPLDTDEFRVIGVNLPPTQCAEPKHLCPEDLAVLLKWALQEVGITHLHAIVGASLGGMIGMTFARLYPEMVAQLVVFCAAHRPSPMAAAVRGIQREILELTTGTNREAEGVSLARKLAMTTYRSAEEFDQRFGPAQSACLTGYLEYQGQTFADRVGSARYASLSAAIDAHREMPQDIRTPVTLVASDTDRVVPLSLMNEFAARLPNLERYDVIRSVYGHDAFLKETAAVGAVLKRVLHD